MHKVWSGNTHQTNSLPAPPLLNRRLVTMRHTDTLNYKTNYNTALTSDDCQNNLFTRQTVTQIKSTQSKYCGQWRVWKHLLTSNYAKTIGYNTDVNTSGKLSSDNLYTWTVSMRFACSPSSRKAASKLVSDALLWSFSSAKDRTGCLSAALRYNLRRYKYTCTYKATVSANVRTIVVFTKEYRYPHSSNKFWHPLTASVNTKIMMLTRKIDFVSIKRTKSGRCH